MKASATAFDSGFEAEAKRLAVSLRVLLHDTNSSRALLDQLGVKNKLRFTETSEPMDQYSLGPMSPTPNAQDTGSCSFQHHPRL